MWKVVRETADNGAPGMVKCAFMMQFGWGGRRVRRKKHFEFCPLISDHQEKSFPAISASKFPEEKEEVAEEEVEEEIMLS